jgi:capsid protein
MNDKKVILWTIIIVLFIGLASFGAGFYIGYRLSSRQDGQTLDQYRAEREDFERRIAEYKRGFDDASNMVRNVNRNISGAIDRVSAENQYIGAETREARETFTVIRSAIKDLENSRRDTTGFIDKLDSGEYRTGE